MSPPIFCAAAMVLSVALLSAAPSCSAMTRMVMQCSLAYRPSFDKLRTSGFYRSVRAELSRSTNGVTRPGSPLSGDDFVTPAARASRNHLGFVAQLRHQLFRIGDLAAALAL